MDTRIIEVRKNIIIHATLDNDTTFSFPINGVTFIPDEMIVKLISYTAVANEPGNSCIYTDIVSDIIGSFVQDIAVMPGITFTLRKPICGLYKFDFRDTGNSPFEREGNLFIHLEFVKYKTDLLDKKIY